MVQCRAARRCRRARRDRRRRDRAVPHRIPVPRLGDAAAARAPVAAVQGRARSGGRQAGGVPHGRYRRRQGAALSQHARRRQRGEPGDGLARAAARARTRRADEGAGARADRGGRRARRSTSCSRWSASRGSSTRRKATCSRRSAPGSAARGKSCRPRSAMARCSKCRRSPSMLDMLLPKIDFLSIGTNDLTQFLFAADRAQSQARRALRLAEPVDPALPQARGRRARRRGRAGWRCAARWAGGRSRRWR